MKIKSIIETTKSISDGSRDFWSRRMSKTNLKQKWYAMYRGDTFIDLGTADYLAEKYHKKKQSLLYLSKPAYHRNAPKNSQRLTLYKMED